jgi:hypothetical protein
VGIEECGMTNSVTPPKAGARVQLGPSLLFLDGFRTVTGDRIAKEWNKRRKSPLPPSAAKKEKV